MKRLLLILAFALAAIVATAQDYPPYQIRETVNTCIQVESSRADSHYPLFFGEVQNLYLEPVSKEGLIAEIRQDGRILYKGEVEVERILQPSRWYPFSVGGYGNTLPIDKRGGQVMLEFRDKASNRWLGSIVLDKEKFIDIKGNTVYRYEN